MCHVDSGTSDPYVKFKVDGKTCYRSRTVMRNLNPKWDEKFTLMLNDLSTTIDVRVYDYDRGLRDDWMGSATIQPSQLPFNVSVLHLGAYSGFQLGGVNRVAAGHEREESGPLPRSFF